MKCEVLDEAASCRPFLSAAGTLLSSPTPVRACACVCARACVSVMVSGGGEREGGKTWNPELAVDRTGLYIVDKLHFRTVVCGSGLCREGFVSGGWG